MAAGKWRLMYAARLLLLGWACSSYFKASLLNRGVRGFPFVPMSHSAKRSLIAYHLLLWYGGLHAAANAGDSASLFARLLRTLSAKVRIERHAGLPAAACAGCPVL
jgi:hypothetical protein